MLNKIDDIFVCMNLCNYGVELIPLAENNIELVRQWRNNPKISQFMEFREYITSKMQQQWFETLDKESNFYYIIYSSHKSVGVINIKNYNAHTKSGEGGIFIADDMFLNTDLAYRAHLVLFDYFFENTALESIKSHILEENKRAIRFCEFLGGQKIGNKEYIITKNAYLSNKNRERFVNKWNKLKEK